MKILSIVTQLESGGAQTVAIELHREFIRRGHNSRLLFLYEKDPHAFPRRDFTVMLGKRVTSSLQYATILSRLRRNWREFSPDAILAHTHFSNNIAAMVKATGACGNLIPVHHNVYSSYPSIARRMDVVARCLRLYYSEICVSSPVSQSINEISPNINSITINNGLDLNISKLTKPAARSSFGLPNDAFIIGNIGRLTDQKNQLFLVRLLPQLDNAVVAVLGDGPLHGILLSEAKNLGVLDRLFMIGSVVHERVPDFLVSLDVFAMPSLFEGLSIAMLEAFASGTPFVGNDVASISAVAENGAGTVLPLDPRAWISEIERIRDDEEYAAALSSRQKSRARDFTLTAMADRYLSVVGSDVTHEQ